MKKLLPWLLIGLAIRLGLMMYSVHPDIRGHNLASYLIAQKGQILSFYDYLRLQPRTDPWVMLYRDDIFSYPPLAYLTHALANFILYPLYPQQLFHLLILDIGQTVSHPQLPWLLLLLKFPYLVADAICLFIINRLLEPKHRILGSVLWIFNPLVLYSAYMLAQFDIFIALFILLALLRPGLSPVFMGLAAGFKPFPLFFLPFLPGSKFKNIALGLLTYFLMSLPYLPSEGFRQYALLASQTDKISYAKIAVSGSQYLPLFFVGLVLLFWLNYFRPKLLPSWGWPMSVLLLFYSVTHFHPQWFTWITPFLILTFIYFRKSLPLLVTLLLCYLIIVLSFESSLNFGLVGLNFSASHWLTDVNVSLIRAALAGTSLGLIWLLSTRNTG